MDVWRAPVSGGTAERLTNVNRDIRYLALLNDRSVIYVLSDQNGANLAATRRSNPSTKATRRISSGLEVYSSIDATADGRRLVATVSNPTANLWSLPILDRLTNDDDVKPLGLPTVRAFAPRYGGASIYYLSSRGGGDGLWRYVGTDATEIWRGSEGALLEPPAVTHDGRRVAVILQRQGKRTLTLLSSEGGDAQPLAQQSTSPALPVGRPTGSGLQLEESTSTAPGYSKSRWMVARRSAC